MQPAGALAGGGGAEGGEGGGGGGDGGGDVGAGHFGAGAYDGAGRWVCEGKEWRFSHGIWGRTQLWGEGVVP